MEWVMVAAPWSRVCSTSRFGGKSLAMVRKVAFERASGANPGSREWHVQNQAMGLTPSESIPE
jgi:hypothetical protein